MCRQEHPEESVPQEGVLGLPLRLTVQVLQEGGQHGDVGGFTSAKTQSPHQVRSRDVQWWCVSVVIGITAER